MPSGVYLSGKQRIAAGLPWNTAALRVALTVPAYVFNAAHGTLAAIQSFLLGPRAALGARQVIADVDADLCRLVAGPTSFAGVDGEAGGAVIYLRQGPDDSTPTNDVLVSYYEFASPVLVSGDNLLVRWSPDGALRLL